MDGREELTQPPAGLAKRSDIEPGDIFCHRVPRLRDPQVWIWRKSDNGRYSWQSVMRGYVRDIAQRRLFFSGDPKRPSFITKEWYRKLVRKEQKEEEERSTIPAKNKGKAHCTSWRHYCRRLC